MSRANEEELSRDLVFDILSNPRRRYVLFYLREHEDEIGLQELASEVAAWENEVEVEELTRAQRKRVYVSLYQTHIPKLESAGIVEHDSEAGTVRLTNRAREVESYIEPDSGETTTWSLYYVALATISIPVFLAVAFDVGLFAVVPDVIAGTVIILAFVALAATQYVYTVYGAPDGTFENILGR